MKSEFTVFYSWQSDLDNGATTNYIRTSINSAIDALKPRYKINLTEDSRDSYRDKNIDMIILEKIQNSDLFICDVTPICCMNDKSKFIPNPNVMFELGYASGVLGWARCILVWNSAYADIKEAPFDIRNRSAVTYYKAPHNNGIDENNGLKVDFKKIFEDKISKYDEIIESQKGNFWGIDYKTYKYWNSRLSFQNIQDIVNGIICDCAYNDVDFGKFDSYQYDFINKLANHFKDENLETDMRNLISSISDLFNYLAINLPPTDKTNRRYKVDVWSYPGSLTREELVVRENTIMRTIQEKGKKVIENNKKIYNSIEEKFGYLED